MTRDWKLFWADQHDPRHPKTSGFSLSHGGEFGLMGVNATGKRVLELGCGSGSLFEVVGFDSAKSYRGVDFSEKMLETFRATHPGVSVQYADAANYIDESKYDLIFSNALIQYFSPNMVENHFANARSMLAPGGMIVIGSIPWRGARVAFHLRAYYPGSGMHVMKRLAVLARSYAGIDAIGHWHSYRIFSKLAQKHGLTATYFGCVQYPYRFHARMSHTVLS